jgi:tRNA(Ile)-lysidine synthetase-like protein
MILKAVIMLERFKKTLTGACGVKPGDGVLACCSGGVDSMVLLRLMKKASMELGLNLHAVTVDHGLRCEAPGDAQFVLDTCEALGVEASLYELKMNPKIPNLEEAARIRRYEAIRDCRNKLGFKFIATGHTADDQAETIIYRLIRGTGIRGMSGMDYAGPNGLIRPMLDITRAEVEAYAEANGVRFVTDQTNNDLTLVRNLIRKRILPVMREINPLAQIAISRFASIAAIENAYIADEAYKLIGSALIHDWNVCRVYDARMLKDAPAALLHRMIIKLSADILGDPRGIPATDVEQSLMVIRGKSRAHTIMRRVRITRDGNYLSFERYPSGHLLSLSCKGFPDEPQTVIKNDGVYSVNPIEKRLEIKGIADGRNAEVRFYLRGDRVQDKKVAGIFQEKRIPLPLRKYWPVILLDHEIVSIAGLLDTGDIKTIFPYES